MKSRDFLGIGVTRIIHYGTKWGWNQVLDWNQIGYGGWDQMAILLTPFLSLRPYCVTPFEGRPHNEDVSLPPANKVATFADRKELCQGRCPSDTGGNWTRKSIAFQYPPNRKNNTAWSGLNRKLVTLKQTNKNLRLPWETFLWISLPWTHPDCTETRTHLCFCSTITATSEPRPTLLLTWVPLWTARLLVLIRRIASRWPCLPKAVSQVTLDLRPPRNKRQKEMGFLCILMVFPGVTASRLEGEAGMHARMHSPHFSPAVFLFPRKQPTALILYFCPELGQGDPET